MNNLPDNSLLLNSINHLNKHLGFTQSNHIL